MHSELIYNIKTLFKQSKKLSKININGEPIKGHFATQGLKYIIATISALLVYLKGNGFSSEFFDFVTSYLSILIGLFITALIFSFDKFYEVKDEAELKAIQSNARLRLWDIQAYNYTKKFAFMTSQTIVISIFALSIVAVESLFPELSKISFETYSFVSVADFTWISIVNALKLIGIFVLRFLVLFWLMKIMANTLYIVSGMVEYMIKKNDQPILNKDIQSKTDDKV